MQIHSTGSSPTISVVIPVYNSAATLADTLQSVLAQSVPPMEIIVVNDGSTDDTAAVMRQFAGKIREHHQKNGGLATARQAGIGMAKGQFIALLDGDDLCEPDRFAIQFAYLRAHPEVLLTSTDFSAFDDKGDISPSYATSYYGAFNRYSRGINDIFAIEEQFEMARDGAPASKIQTFRGVIYEKLVLGNFIHPPTIMFRRKLLELAGNFDPASGVMCDWDWIMHASKYGQFGYIAKPLLRYRISATQQSSERYRYRRSIGNIQVIDRIRARDPEIYLRYKAEFKGKLGTYCLDAADAICEQNRVEAIKWLIRAGICYRNFSGQSLRILAKIMMPSWLRHSVRQLRNKPQAV